LATTYMADLPNQRNGWGALTEHSQPESAFPHPTQFARAYPEGMSQSLPLISFSREHWLGRFPEENHALNIILFLRADGEAQ